MALYIAPFEVTTNYSEAVPGPVTKKGLKQTIKRDCQVTCNSRGRPFQIEGPAAEGALILFSGRVRTWY